MEEDANEKRNERATREGFAKNRVVWFGGVDDWQRDWMFFLENSHTLLSMCRGHALHHFDRFDRFAHLCCVLCFNLFVSAWLQLEKNEDETFVYYAHVAAWSVVLVAYDNVLRFLATSPCFHVGGRLHGFICRECCRDCGRHGLYLCLGASVGLALFGVLLAIRERVEPQRFFGTFVAMRLFSYVAEIAPLSATFYYRREVQRKYWQQQRDDPSGRELAGEAYPLGIHWPTPHYLEERRHVSERFVHASNKVTTERNARARRMRSQERSRRAQRLKDFSAKPQLAKFSSASPSSIMSSSTDDDLELATFLPTSEDDDDDDLAILAARRR